MPGYQLTDSDFLRKATQIIEDNIGDERFGVSELARELSMSRSNLLRKIKKDTRLSVSQFIRQVRLKHAMEMLKQSSFTVSEVSYKVGFSSTSYFIKCFREYYGYPPGEAGRRENKSDQNSDSDYKNHQLAAIMFTDIQGYTALMQQDEEKAVAFRNRHREVFNSAIARFNGRILQYYGDGTLSTFPSAIDAVKCAIEMQIAFLTEPQIPVRIGIHTGDIIFTEDDIIGDGVNVASRIESLAASGSVFISEKVYDEVKNQSGIQTTSMGLFDLKNVDKSIEVFAIANSELFVPDKDQVGGKAKPHLKPPQRKTNWIRAGIAGFLAIAAAIVIIYLVGFTDLLSKKSRDHNASGDFIGKKSIAVLPFINDSHDSSNVYIINGLMESVLNNLQKIEDLRVVSRTSVEKFRNSALTIAEIAEELNVNYFVEGSGQKIDDQIMLSIQLIDAEGDRHLWAEQYNREVSNIFALQSEVAKNIADQIQVIITPEEEKRIDKTPTNNLVAYDYFLKGLDLFHKGKRENIEEAITWFRKAIRHDNRFSRAYADIGMAYYYLELFKQEKQFSDSINHYADLALQYDPQSSRGLIAKGLFFMNSAEYELAVPYFEKALEYNPNSAFVINTLSDFYTNYMPDTEKYLEYALKGIQLEIGTHDSVTASYIYLHLSNALIQSGFTNEALKYINKSIQLDPTNLFSAYVKPYILYAKNKDLEETRDLLIKTLQRDTTRIDILQEVGKIHYYLRDYRGAWKYYKRFIEIRENQHLDVFRHENAKIATVLAEVGFKEKSEQYFNDYKAYAENDQSIYRNLSRGVYYAKAGDTKKALEQLKLFSKESNYQYWIILFLKIDPLIDNIKDMPEFKKIFRDIENKFWKNHERIKLSLQQKALI